MLFWESNRGNASDQLQGRRDVMFAQEKAMPYLEETVCERNLQRQNKKSVGLDRK